MEDAPKLDVVPKKQRAVIEDEFDDEVLAVIKVGYIGINPANLNLDDEPDRTINDVLREEIDSQRLHLQRSKAKATKMFIIVSRSRVTLFNREDNTVHQIIPASVIEELYLNEDVSPATFAFAHHNSRLGIDYINVLEVKSKYLPYVEPLLEEAVRTKKEYRMSKVDARALGISQRIVGVYLGLYLGKTAVSKKAGKAVVEDALMKLRRQQKRAKERLLQTTIVVSRENVSYMETFADDLLFESHIQNISYCDVLEEGKAEEVLTFIEKDDRLDNIICHVFLCRPGVADGMCRAVGQATQRMLEEQERKQDNPFHPDTADQEPEVVEGDLEHKQLDRTKLTAIKVLGAGQFGTVYMAGVANDDQGEDDSVAVKMLRTESSDADATEFRYECEVMAQLSHPNILNLVGVCFEHRPWLCVLEIMNYGDMRKVLQTCHSKNLNLTLLERYVCIEQALAGMVYLAGQGFVHMDLAARNMLLHDNNLVKIADFGICHAVDPETKKFRLKGHLRLAVRWMAPETLGGKRIYFSERTDVYSFAVFMWEVFENGVLPFAHLKSRVAKQEIQNGLILAQPDACPVEVYDIMLQAWNKDPEARPTFAQVHEAFRNIKLEEEQTSDTKPRDIGSSLNAVLSQNLRRLSMKASVVRRQGGSTSNSPKKNGFASDLSTMREEDEEGDESAGPSGGANLDGEDNQVKAVARAKRPSVSAASPASMASSPSDAVQVNGESHDLVNRQSETFDPDMFEDGSQFTEAGSSDKLSS
eukprot:TRINITY_DN11181_c0_g1_i4.p1 TRINITY_DN11181_c0_g1~~TRINITY_DN11181_c0_g1_i4.p1  ORF type:complete len:758 (+),score=224.97 TRINITY_DN11181_c0_g1_i4:94-2367(+)